jgi:hypothetical protein
VQLLNLLFLFRYRVNSLEFMAVFILLSPCSLQEKQETIFRLMDFDGSATMSKDELVCLH